MTARVDLDVVGVLEGSGRSSVFRQSADTLRHYETILAPYRRGPVTILDLAAQTAGSIAVWQWYFPHAHIVAVSTDAEIAAAANGVAGPGGVVVEPTNPANTAAVERLAANLAPTIVLDDAAHRPEHIVPKLERVFRHVAPGGLYIVENLCKAPGTEAARPEAAAIVQHLAEAAAQLGAQRPPTRAARQDTGALHLLAETIAFVPGAVLLHRHAGEPDLSRALATADGYLAAHRRDAGALERLALYILRHRGPATRAEEAANAAILAEGPTLARLLLLADIQTLLQQLDDLRGTLGKAQQMTGSPADHARLARLLAAQGERQAALAQALTAAALAPRNPAFAKLVESLSD